MKALTRCALIAALLLLFSLVLPVGGALATDGDMPGNGYGHCRNYPNSGHDHAEEHGMGHTRDGGQCADAPQNGGDPGNGGNAGTDGDDGDDGDDGRDGKDGRDGRDGKDGRDGRDGKDGKDGRDGRDGTDGDATGGTDGADGRDGKDGKDGKDGRDGTTTTSMPGNGYGHCRNYPNSGHDAAEEHGKGHLRDGGTCADAPWNDDDANTDGDDGDDGDDGRDGRDGDDGRDGRDGRNFISGDTRAAGEGTMPIDDVNEESVESGDTEGALGAAEGDTAGAVETAGTEGAEGVEAASAEGEADDDAAAGLVTPGRIDAGLGGLFAGSPLRLALSLLALAALTAAAVLFVRQRRDVLEG